jgi:hypothetical protein
MTTLQWNEDQGDDGRAHYTADVDDRYYSIGPFDAGARDGDLKLTIHDGRYRSECRGLIQWVGNMTRGLVPLFDTLGDALLAAQSIEDQRR